MAGDGSATRSRGQPVSPVLVVEDEPDMRQLMVGLLREDGYPAIGAADGAEALRLVRNGPRPCLILLDLVMPNMDGWRFREEIQRYPKLASIPTVVVSGYGQELKKRPIGAVAQLQKPLDLDTLLAVVERYCRKNGRDAD